MVEIFEIINYPFGKLNYIQKGECLPKNTRNHVFIGMYVNFRTWCDNKLDLYSGYPHDFNNPAGLSTSISQI